MNTLYGFIACVGLVVCQSACSGANWTSSTVAPGYTAPTQLTITLKHAEGLEGAAARLSKLLVSELRKRGIDATVEDEVGAPPNAVCDVKEWEPGNRIGRSFAGFIGAGEGHVLVDVEVSTSEEARGALTGTLRGYVRSGVFGGADINSIEAAAEEIAEAIATGELE